MTVDSRATPRRPRGGLCPVASSEEKCIFCLSADGWQYVPLHFERTTKGDRAEVRYSEILASHTACGPCWAQWERRATATAKTTATAPRCPMCQRDIDVRQGYEDANCKDCLSVLLKTTRSRPRPAVRSPICSSHMKCCCSVLIIFTLVVTFNVACDIMLQIGGQRLAQELSHHSLGAALKLPPGLYSVLCNDEVKAALDALTQDPILRFTTSFLQEIVAEGCRRPGPNVNDDAMRDAEQVFDDLRREEL